jgi:hypothetical protein
MIRSLKSPDAGAVLSSVKGAKLIELKVPVERSVVSPLGKETVPLKAGFVVVPVRKIPTVWDPELTFW